VITSKIVEGLCAGRGGVRSAYSKRCALVQFAGCRVLFVHHLVTAAAQEGFNSSFSISTSATVQVVAPWMRGAVVSGLSPGEEAVVAGLCGQRTSIDTEGTGANQTHTPAMSCDCFLGNHLDFLFDVGEFKFTLTNIK
jgi:hypothetical protein